MLQNRRLQEQTDGNVMSKREYRSVLEKQKPKGEPNAKDYRVQTGGGGAFVLQHRESGDYYADYVTTPITSWGAKRFLTLKEAYAYLDNSDNFKQPSRKPDRTRMTRAE